MRSRSSRVAAAVLTFTVVATNAFDVTPTTTVDAADGQGVPTGQMEDRPITSHPSSVAVKAAPIDLSGPSAGAEILADGTMIRPSDRAYVAPSSATEVVSARTEHGRKVANPDGTFTVEASAGRMNYRDAGGSWQPLDFTLIEASDGTLRVKGHDRDIRLGIADAGKMLATMSADGVTVTLRSAAYGPATVIDGAIHAERSLTGPEPDPAPAEQSNETPSPAPDPTGLSTPSESPVAIQSPDTGPTGVGPSASSIPSAQPSPLPLPSATPSASPSAVPASTASPLASEAPTPTNPPTPGHDRVTVAPADDGIEFGAILEDAEAATSYRFIFDFGGLIATPDTDLRTILLQRTTTADTVDLETVGVISAPVMFDANHADAPPDAVTVSIEALASGEIELTYDLDPGWLALATYPVTLDPTACIQVGGSGCTINGSTSGYKETYGGSNQGGTYPTTPSVLRAGEDAIGSPDAVWANLRSYLYFPSVSMFPAGTSAAVVTSATLSLREDRNYEGANQNLYARVMKKGWSETSTYNQLHDQVLTGYDSPAVATCSTGTTDCTVDFDVTKAARAWYTRRGKDWRPNYGFEVRLVTESASQAEVDFYISGNGTVSNRPKLVINYEVPKVGIDFDAALGANFAPSSMVAAVPTKLPIIVSNNASGFVYDKCTSAGDSDCYVVGYRFFDTKGEVAASDWTDLPANVPSAVTAGQNPTPTFALSVTAPGTPGSYSLRLDLAHRIGGSSGTFLWASDWAQPSKFNSRNKKILTSDNTRWVGSASVERDEFGIAVGRGGNPVNVTSVGTGDGGTLGIDLATRNLHYEGAGGIGLGDLIPLGLEYGYNSKNAAADCAGSTYRGVLGGCGWYTNWDERLTDTSTTGNAGAYTYHDPTGDRHFMGTDGEGQISGGSSSLVSRPRVTLFDENGAGGTVATGVSVLGTETPHGDSTSGERVLKVNSNTTTDLSAYIPASFSLNTYGRNLNFSMQTTVANGTGIAFKIHDASDPGIADAWMSYTVGVDWASPYPRYAKTGSLVGQWLTVSNLSLYDDVRNLLPGGAYDDYEVTGFKILSKPSSTGFTYLDAAFLRPGSSTLLSEPTYPTFTANNAKASDFATDGAQGSGHSLKVTPGNLAASPQCTASPCWTTTGPLYAYPFGSWDWKKVGGASVALRLDFKDLRAHSGGTGVYKTGSITYYAGATPPADAVNAVQVSAELPTDWAHVTRNLLEDARQILNFYNDAPAGTSAAAPPNGPVGDDVSWIGYVASAVDGSYALFDNLMFGGLPSTGTTALSAPDFTVTNADRSVHAFNRDGLLASIADRDGNQVTLDYSYDAGVANGQASYTLTAIHGPSDGSSFNRQIDVSRGSGTVTFTEGMGANGSPTSGRSTVFTVSGGDVTSVKPARRDGACAGSGPSGCALYGYSGSTHLLATVADPRWDQTSTSGGDADRRFSIDWTTTAGDPSRITDESHNGATGADLVRVLAWDRSPGTALGTRVLWQDGSAIVANAARHSDVIVGGRTLTDYVPQGCASNDCLTAGNWPSGTDGTLASLKRVANEFDGLTQTNRTTTYRTPSAAAVITRSASQAGARVDNYINPLLGGQLAWTQTADQLYASRADSGNSNDDLYRTTYRYNDRGEPTHVVAPAYNARSSYPTAVLTATPNGTAAASTDMYGYYRLDETSGAVLDSDGNPQNSSSNIDVTQGVQSWSLTPAGANKAATYNGTSSVTTLSSFGTVQGSYSVVAWMKPAIDAPSLAFIGSRKGTPAGTDPTFNAKLGYDATTGSRWITVDVGNGSAWLTNFATPARWQAGRWVQVGVVVDDATDTLSVYADGELVGSTPFSVAGLPMLTDANRRLKIGNNGRETVNHEWFNGSIDEVAIYRVPLEPSQVRALFLASRSMASVDTATLYDAEGHPTQVTDQFLANPGFEAGINAGWRPTNASWSSAAQHTGKASVALAASGSVAQEITLVPGQTFRFQGWNQGAGAVTYKVEYWDTQASTWTSIQSSTHTDGAWTSHAWDVTLPTTTDGRIRISTGNAGGGTVNVDDLAVFTTWSQMAYEANGLVDTTTRLSPAGTGVVVTNRDYAATATIPAIFATSVIANDVGTVTDPTTQDLTTTSTYDGWGRPLVVTDPDGVSATSHYVTTGNGAMTDVDTVTDALGNTTTTSYDLVGNPLSVTSPLGALTATTYDLLDHPLRVTAPDTTITAYEYDLAGQQTAVIANYVDGTPSSGIDDVRTTSAYDEDGRVIRTDADDTGVDAVTTMTYDLLGNLLTSTTYPGANGTGTARTTTSDFAPVANGLSRSGPTGVRLPIVPTTGGPACPSGTGMCNTVTSLDLDGQPIAVTDAYTNTTKSLLDLAGRPVLSIVNHVNGANPNDGSEVDTDLITTTTYKVSGQVDSVTGPAGRTATTTYDAVGRSTVITAPSGLFTKTLFTKGGRVARASDPAASGTADADLTWTRSVYDKAGRQTKTIAHLDPSGNAQLGSETFEDGGHQTATSMSTTDDQLWATSGILITTGATATTQLGTAPKSGQARLAVTTGTGANAGSEWTLAGTFKSGHTYKATAWILAPAGTTIETRLGSASDTNGTAATIAGTGAWQQLTVTWTPAADRTAVAFAARRQSAAASITFYLDDVTVWDDSASGINPRGKDSNIPTETVYDADGRVVRSIIIGGKPGDPSLVTKTTYDSGGRVTAVIVNEVAGAGTGDTVSNLTTSTTYDALGRATDVYDPDSIRTVYAYDRLARTVATTLNHVNGTSSGATGADDVRSTFAYDATGGLTGYCPAVAVVAGCVVTSGSDARAWRYAIDAMGRTVSQTPPDNSTITALDVTAWAYEGGGRLGSVTDQTAGGTVHRHTDLVYDRTGRVLTSKVYAGYPGSLKQTTTRTWTIDGTPASVAFDGTGDGVGTPATVGYVYDGLGRLDQVKRGTTVMTDYAWNPDDTISGRVDTNPVSTGTTYTSAFAYDWAKRPVTLTAASVFSGTASMSYRLDGLLASRATPNGETVSLAYDAARRPITASLAGGGSISQTYDRVGNVATEARSLSGVTGDNGTGTNDFSYDALRRLTGETGLASSRSYQYDLNGNRTRKVEGATTIDYEYDATDQLKLQRISGSPTGFAYNAYGDLTTSRNSIAAQTDYSLDTASHLVAINAPGTTQDVALTLDALGRFKDRTVNGVTDSYAYVADSETVLAIVGATTRLSALAADGSRIATKDGSTTGYLVPDLHGNVVAAQQSAATAIAVAMRYDGYGQTLGSPYTGTGAIAMDARYQGRLDLSATSDPLYDMSARFYAPGLGTFTALDSVLGSAQNPLSMNRFLYAEANPSTFIDPTGHAATRCEGSCMTDTKANVENAKQAARQAHQRGIERQRRGGASTRTGGTRSVTTSVIPYAELPTWNKNCFRGGCTWSQSVPTDWGESALTACSFIPIAGTGCDAEDLRRNVERGDVVGAALAGVGFVWGLGDVLKFAGKSANLAVDTVVRNLSGSDDLAEATLRALARGASKPPNVIQGGLDSAEWVQARAWAPIRGGDIIGNPKSYADAADLSHNGVPVSLKRLEGADSTFISQILDASDDLSGLTKDLRVSRVNRVGAEGWITAQSRTTEQVLALIDQPFRSRNGRTIASTLGGQGFSALLFRTSDGLVVITR